MFPVKEIFYSIYFIIPMFMKNAHHGPDKHENHASQLADLKGPGNVG